MTGRQPVEDRSASIDLSAPLEEVWSFRQPHVPALPIVADGLVFYGDSQRHTTAISEERRVKLWQSTGKLAPQAWWAGFLVGYASDDQKLQMIDPESGRTRRETGILGGSISCAANERWVVGTGYGEQTTLWCVEPSETKVVWANTVEKGVFVAGPGPIVTGDTVVVALDSGEVLAWDAATGTRRWASTVADLKWRRHSGLVEPGRVRTRPSIFGDRIILTVIDHYVAAIALEDGSRSWSWGGAPFVMRDGQVLNDEYYVLGWSGDYRILDARNGQEKFAINLQQQVPRDLGITLAPPLLVTPSHILVGSDQGNVTAFERASGRFAWTFRPKAAGSTEVGYYEFVVGSNRIYYGDSTFRIRCLGPKGTKAPRSSRKPSESRLPLDP